jgi:hypothetical protein
MKDTGLSTLTNLSSLSSLQKNTFLETKKIKDVWKNFYIGDGAYYSIDSVDDLKLKIKREINSLGDEINNLKIIDNKLTFINQQQELKILNNDYTCKPFEITNRENKTIPLYRNTENLYIGINGEMYQKSNKEQIISDISKTTEDNIPILQDEINGYYIRNDIKDVLYKYNKIEIGDYSFLVNNITDIEKVYQFNDEYLLLIEGNKIYYYYPENNIYYLKY